MEEQPMKTYYGVPKESGGGIVTVRDKGGHSTFLAHHVRHSPDGFNWGYGGSGPIELARCLLLDAFGTTRCPSYPEQCRCGNEWAEANYQGFALDVLSKMEQSEDWKLGQLTVCEWVFDNKVAPTIDGVVEEVGVGVEVLA
jgi:hypothetical protein